MGFNAGRRTREALKAAAAAGYQTAAQSAAEMTSAVNRELFQQQAPAHVRIMNARRNAKGTITAMMHQNTTTEVALLYRDMIIKAARSVDKGIIDVEGNESWERQEIHTVPLVRHMGKGTEAL